MRNIRSILGAALFTACSSGTEPVDLAKHLVLTAASPTSMTHIAGNAVANLPTVIAYDESGSPLPGVAIVFEASPGAGIIYGAVDTTNSAGVAQLGGWLPGTKAGEKAVVTARSPNGSVVAFAAEIIPGAALRIVKVAGDNQVAVVEEQVPINPKAKVTDEFGNPISGAVIKFGVKAGGGSVKPDVATTDADGMVMASAWTLGSLGEQILTLDAGTIVQSFHARAVATALKCSQQTELVPMAPLLWQLTADNCSVNGKYFTIFYFTTSAISTWAFDMQSTAFDTYLELRDANSTAIAHSDKIIESKDSRIRAVIRPGIYQLVAAANRAGDTGPFALWITRTPPVPSGCDALFVNRGDSTSGEVIPVTCNGIDLGNVHLYRMHLSAGETVQIHLRDLTYSGFEIDIQKEDGTPLVAAQPGLTYLDYDATYSADEDVNIVIRLSSGDTSAGYWITFK